MRTRTPETVTIVRPVIDNYGNISSQASTSVDGCTVLPRDTGSEKQSVDDDQVTINLTIIVPSGTDVLVTDEVIVRGDKYQVANTPSVLLSPFSGRDSGIGVQLKRTTG